MIQGIKKVLAMSVIQLMIALAFTLLLAPTYRAEAGFSPTMDSVNISPEALDQLGVDLESKKVSKVFEELGFDAQEIQTRMSGLDSKEIHLLAGDLENSLVPSGDGSTALILGAVALVLLVIFVLWFLKGLAKGIR
jgi:hypothetical protein